MPVGIPSKDPNAATRKEVIRRFQAERDLDLILSLIQGTDLAYCDIAASGPEKLLAAVAKAEENSANNFSIFATARSDDYAVQLTFDAVDWFRQCTAQELADLIAIEFGGNYASDAVAQFFSDTTTESLFAYIDLDPHVFGFECHIDRYRALRWMEENRPLILDEASQNLVNTHEGDLPDLVAADFFHEKITTLPDLVEAIDGDHAWINEWFHCTVASIDKDGVEAKLEFLVDQFGASALATEVMDRFDLDLQLTEDDDDPNSHHGIAYVLESH
jgi:hypothetical protein